MDRSSAGALAGIAGLCALALFSAGCDARRAQGSPPPERIRKLNELPIEQLRVMLRGYDGDWRTDTDADRQLPAPPAAKPIPPGAKRIPLVPPTKLSLGGRSVRDAIAARRSVRDFSDAPLTREELSFLLWATQGVTAIQRDDSGKIEQTFRAAPSAGGRHPLETYMVVARVDGIAPGIYRYNPEAHELITVREDAATAAGLKAACYDQPFVGDAAVVFIWSAVPYRTEWKYAYISHRMIAMEAGHVCENLCLAAESLGAGACAVMAYQQPRVDELIGADGKDEFALYLACVGKRASGAR